MNRTESVARMQHVNGPKRAMRTPRVCHALMCARWQTPPRTGPALERGKRAAPKPVSHQEGRDR